MENLDYLFEDIEIETKDLGVLKKRIDILINEKIVQEREIFAYFILDYFNENPKIEDKSDLRLFLDDLEENLDVNLSYIEKKLD